MKIYNIFYLILFSFVLQSQEYNKDLLKAAKTGDFARVTRLLALDADVNCRDKRGATSLVRAAYDIIDHSAFNSIRPASINSLKTIKRLLNAQADPNIPDRNGCTPLSLALEQYNPAIIKLLLEAGASTSVIFRERAYNNFDGNYQDTHETILDYVQKYCNLQNIAPTVTRYASLCQAAAVNPTEELLQEAINLGFPALVHRLLKDLKLSVDKEMGYLTIAKHKFGITRDTSYQAIGRLLVHRLGLISRCSGLSRNGIIGIQLTNRTVLPADIAHIIRYNS